jgi:hypothetical protein
MDVNKYHIIYRCGSGAVLVSKALLADCLANMGLSASAVSRWMAWTLLLASAVLRQTELSADTSDHYIMAWLYIVVGNPLSKSPL